MQAAKALLAEERWRQLPQTRQHHHVLIHRARRPIHSDHDTFRVDASGLRDFGSLRRLLTLVLPMKSQMRLNLLLESKA